MSDLAFTNRNKQLAQFSRVIKLSQGATLIVVSGPRKIGKSRLLEEYRDRCKKWRIPHAYLKLTKRHSYIHILSTLCESLVASSGIGPEFPELVQEFQRLEQREQKAKQSQFPSTLFQIIHIDGDVVASAVGGTLDAENVAGRDITTQRLNEVMSQESSPGYLDNTQDLTSSFIRFLEQVDAPRLVILIDHYDLCNKKTEDWLFEAFLYQVQKNPRVVIGIAGCERNVNPDDILWDRRQILVNLADLGSDDWLRSVRLERLPEEAKVVFRYLYDSYGDRETWPDALKRLKELLSGIRS